MSVTTETWLDDLNPQQRAAVTHGGGPLLVVAGAGSGRTWPLAYRVVYLIRGGTPPGRILLLAFTRRAAEEMLKRARSFLCVLWQLRCHHEPSAFTDRHSYAQRCRFLTEEVVATIEDRVRPFGG